MPMKVVNEFGLLVIESIYNDDAISFDTNRSDGDEWVLGIPYPAEELPPSGQAIWVHDTPFLFPNKEDKANNNFHLNNQAIGFNPVSTKQLSFLCSGDNGDYVEQIVLMHNDGDEEYAEVGFCDSVSALPSLGASIAWRCSHSHYNGKDLSVSRTLWLQQVQVDPKTPICGISFDYNPFAHIFCMTVEMEN